MRADSDIQEIYYHLNLITGKEYVPTPTFIENLKKGIQEHGKQAILDMITRKAGEWKGTKFEPYIRPVTLFGNLTKYINERRTNRISKIATAVEKAKSATWRFGRKLD